MPTEVIPRSSHCAFFPFLLFLLNFQDTVSLSYLTRWKRKTVDRRVRTTFDHGKRRTQECLLLSGFGIYVSPDCQEECATIEF